VVAAVVAVVGAAVQRHARAVEHGQPALVGGEAGVGELLGAAGGEPAGELGVVGVDHVHDPSAGPREDRVALGAAGEADEYERRFHRDRAERRRGEVPPALVVVGRGHDGHPAGKPGHGVAEQPGAVGTGRYWGVWHDTTLPEASTVSACTDAAAAGSAWPSRRRVVVR
jgi:hypothetical protein